MKRPLLYIVLTFLMTVNGQSTSDTVTLTDTQGRSIQATIITVMSGTATVRMENGRQYRIPLSKLDEASQKTITTWKLAQLGKKREPFKFSIKNYTEKENERDTGSTRIREYQEGYNVTVENATPMALPELKVIYVMLKEGAIQAASSNKDVVPEQLKGEATLEPMKMRGTSTFRTKSIPMRESRLKSGWSYTSGGRDNAVDELIGICIRIMAGDQIIYEFSRPSSLADRVKWD